MEAFFPIGKLVPLLEAGNGVLAMLGLISWLGILKYFSLVSIFHPFVRVVERCIWNLFRFAQLMVIVLTGFAIALYIACGDQSNLFSTIRGSFVAVMVAPAGGVDLSPVFADGGVLGPALVFTYIIVVFLLLLNTFMAICVDTYSVCTFQINECTAAKRPGEESPTLVFLWTYWNALKGVKLVGKETVEEIGEPSEQQIQLTSLPEVVQNRYLATKKRMEEIWDGARTDIIRTKQLQMDTLSGERDAKRKNNTNGNAALTEDRNKGPRGAALALQDHSNREPRPPSSLKDTSSFPIVEDPTTIYVKRVQLQRMLDDDPVLCEICGSTRAVDIIRRFRVEQSGVDPFQAVAALQSNVARKLAELEANGLDLHFDELETLKQVSTELHSALTESQREWRQELLTVMQMAELLSKTLIELTRKLEAVQLNHNSLTMRVGG
mmetsp:Transcript_89156/g.207491  ORF Transcript_89156/g.207491 Transcript_89156/m.207491 type:complete len:437 (+) Transcript_89156:1-1311(+)